MPQASNAFITLLQVFTFVATPADGGGRPASPFDYGERVETAIDAVIDQVNVRDDSILSLIIQEIDNVGRVSSAELENISVREIRFSLDGEAFSLSNQAMNDANTWSDLKIAMASALEDVGLGDLAISHKYLNTIDCNFIFRFSSFLIIIKRVIL
ncbi:MAG: hypothetical protein VBE63_25035, partial [Lamprobacter sp.]|uniref:hypothetical protein n=1 Tax=Lamprobacter sp. TaxID=3100796 RepID=UPI002B259D08